MARRPSSVPLSVCLSVNFCANRFFSQTNGRIATKLAHDGLQVSVHPGCPQGQDQGQRSRDTPTFWILGMSYSVIDGLVYFFYKNAFFNVFYFPLTFIIYRLHMYGSNCQRANHYTTSPRDVVYQSLISIH